MTEISDMKELDAKSGRKMEGKYAGKRLFRQAIENERRHLMRVAKGREEDMLHELTNSTWIKKTSEEYRWAGLNRLNYMVSKYRELYGE